MKFSAILLGAALYLVSSTEANISTNTPFKTVTWNGGENEKVVWVDDGKAPKLADIGITTIDLMAGGPENQVLVNNIGKVAATAKQIDYNVPKTVGPPGDFYFIRYTAANGFSAFSGTFSIAGVNGNINGFDPKNPNGSVNGTVPPAAGNPKAAVPPTTAPPAAGYPNTPAAGATPPTANTPAAGAAPKAGNPYTTTPKANDSTDAGTPAASASPSSSTSSAAQSSLPTPISNAANLLPSFSGVASAAIAFALTYLF
ncbi:hypothetical protein C1645_765223 [Glomus cerebriforme]|uniref:Ser-Thr-rich glycosyl-phosphatidyl-inositol-anchored membrane family-domain-containing protein n=1 Tax=Glomus cerebriforme TaxID=658196 RepID=A0A397T684_9GLOM|nr:hypothetical protein C1645_765223 [Glomus cerebriforme]